MVGLVATETSHQHDGFFWSKENRIRQYDRLMAFNGDRPSKGTRNCLVVRVFPHL